MLVFSAICPHPPILIPNIGKEHLNEIKTTQKAMEKLANSLAKTKPDTIIIISPHGQLLPQAFVVNLNPNFESNFKMFGDFITKLEFKGDGILAHQIRESAETKIPVVLTSEAELDHGATVPLFYLTQKLPNVKIVPISYSLLDNKTHFEFGKLIKEEIYKTDKRVAVIASGDLSHALTENAPAGYSAQGKVFDERLIKLITKKETEELLNLGEEFVESAAQCGLNSIIILLGILNHVNYETEILSYEGPFGVGYLVANLKI